MLALIATPAEVAAAYSDAPAVGTGQLLEARDWAEPLLERAGVALVPDTRQERAAKRAVMLYALHLATGIKASTLRTSQAATGAVLAERKKVGPLEKEQKFANPQESAAFIVQSADDYLARAWAALYEAGLPLRKWAVGASR